MSVTNNWCPAGLVQFRHAYVVSPDRVQPGSRKGLSVATCTVCDRPNVPVVEKDGKHYLSGHTESNKIGGVTESGRSYSKARERNW